MKLKIIGLSLILVIISALNSGSIGLFGLDIIATIFGFSPFLVRLLYVFIGASGGYLAYLAKDILVFFGNRLLK
jgi:uncharacterized membrane protein YuzA (DUF378 family)